MMATGLAERLGAVNRNICSAEAMRLIIDSTEG